MNSDNRLSELGQRLEVAIEMGDAPAIRSTSEDMLQLSGESAPATMRAGLNLLIADAILSLNALIREDIERARECAETAIELSAPDPQPGLEVTNSWLYLGRAHALLGHAGDEESLDKALAAFKQALASLGEDRQSSTAALIYWRIAEAWERLGDDSDSRFEKAIGAYRAAYNIYGSNNDPLNKGSVAYHLGKLSLEIAQRRGEPAGGSTIDYLEEAVRVYKAAGNRPAHADAVELLTRAGAPQGSPASDDPNSLVHRIRTRLGGVWRWIRTTILRRPDRTVSRPEVLAQMEVPWQRRIFLEKWLEQHWSATPEREAFLRARTLDTGMSEAAAMMHAAETSGDSTLKEQANQIARDAEEFFQYLLSIDRKNDTHDAAIEVLQAHLRDSAPFVLFLRNFDLEVRKARGSERWIRALPQKGAEILFTEMTMVSRSKEQALLSHAISEDLPIVAISDVGDAFRVRTDERIAKLRVLETEWDLVAAMLIGEAASIVLFVQKVSNSLNTVLDLIEQFGASGNTSVLVVERDVDTSGVLSFAIEGHDPESEALAQKVALNAIRKRFDDRLLQATKAPTTEEEARSIAITI